MSNKKSHILYNILESNKDTKEIKRNSDFNNYETKLFDKNLNLNYNLGNKISINEGKNTSFNEPTSANQKNINNTSNEDINKKISSNNSSNDNGSNIFPTGTKQLTEEENNNTNNNLDNDNNNTNNGNNNNTKINKTRYDAVVKKINENKEGYRKSHTNINCNLGENNVIFINISRGRGSAIMNKKDLNKIESTPKMMNEKEQFEEITKGEKNIFSHYCQKRMDEKTQINCHNQIITSEFKLKLAFDMNKYSEETLNIINSIRRNPEYLIKHIDYLMDNNIQKTEEGIFLINQEIDEKIKLVDNYLEMFNKTKDVLKDIINSNKNISKLKDFIYKDDLEITLDKSNNNDNDNDYNDINESENEEEETENDIKNIPSKLNLIYDEDIINFDDDDETDFNQISHEDNSNIIDLDFEDNKKEENKKKGIQISKLPINKIKNDNKKVTFKSIEKKPAKKKPHNINNYLDLNDDKIGNLILEKRKKIKGKYPLNIFKISVIKDIKISILIQIVMEEFLKENKKNSLKEILFSPNYKYFGISWTNEINRNFISISCFA